MRQVEEQLHRFGTVIRPLGPSVGLLASTLYLQTHLEEIRLLFRDNAYDLFPNKVKKESDKPTGTEAVSSHGRFDSRSFRRKAYPRTGLNRHVTHDLEELPDQLSCLANRLTYFLSFLQGIPEFRDESLNASIRNFEGDLRYWASCLQDFKGDLIPLL